MGRRGSIREIWGCLEKLGYIWETWEVLERLEETLGDFVKVLESCVVLYCKTLETWRDLWRLGETLGNFLRLGET